MQAKAGKLAKRKHLFSWKAQPFFRFIQRNCSFIGRSTPSRYDRLGRLPRRAPADTNNRRRR